MYKVNEYKSYERVLLRQNSLYKCTKKIAIKCGCSYGQIQATLIKHDSIPRPPLCKLPAAQKNFTATRQI